MSPGGVFIGLVLLASSPAWAAPAPEASCMRLVQALTAGAVAAASDLEPAHCESSLQDRSFRYDERARVMRSTRDLRVGEIVEELPAFALPVIRPGDRLYIRTQSGPVTVEREVVALQAARAGERLFVRTADGVVFSAALSEARP